MEIINTVHAPAAIGPYSQAAIGCGLVFVSGQFPIDPVSGVMPADAAAAADQCLKNAAAILAAKGLSLANVIKVNIFLRDMADFGAVNEVYARHFSAPFPARACVAVAGLPKDAVVEIECVAAL